MIADARGDLFGTTEQGGAGYPVTTNGGTVFEIQNTGTVAEPVYANTPTMLVSFNGSNGFGPQGLTADANGDLFSTTKFVGYAGTVFEITGSGFIVALPAVQPDSAHVSVARTVSATAANGVLANDTDPIPNDKLTVSAVDGQASNVGHALLVHRFRETNRVPRIHFYRHGL